MLGEFRSLDPRINRFEFAAGLGSGFRVERIDMARAAVHPEKDARFAAIPFTHRCRLLRCAGLPSWHRGTERSAKTAGDERAATKPLRRTWAKEMRFHGGNRLKPRPLVAALLVIRQKLAAIQ